MTPFTSILDRDRQHRQQRQRLGTSRHQQVRQTQQRPPMNNRINRKTSSNIFQLYCNINRSKLIVFLQFVIFSSVYFFALLRPDDSSFQLKTLRATFTNISMSNRSLLDSNENMKTIDISESEQLVSYDNTKTSNNRLKNLIDINTLIETKNKEELQLQSQRRKKRLEKIKKEKLEQSYLTPKKTIIDNHVNETYVNEIMSLNEDVDKQLETNYERVHMRDKDEKTKHYESNVSLNEKKLETLLSSSDNEIAVEGNNEKHLTSESKLPTTDKNGNETISYTENEEESEEFISLFALFCILATFRICLQVQTNQRSYDQMGFSSQFARTSSAVRQAQYNILVSRINQARIENGENPISPDLLLSILRRGRGDFDPNDYDNLLRLNEEAGPSEELLSSIRGLNSTEIERFPSRIIDNTDDDLIILPQPNLLKQPQRKRPQCAICLEHYELGNKVRTLPCFHTFHCHCIDKWLGMKAECPVCKYAAFC